jgi:hypothetical protein
MKQQRQHDYNRLRNELLRLFQAAGYEQQELLDFINTTERETKASGEPAELQAENERLKREVIRLRNLIHAKTESSMSSKLRDALRE